MIGDTDRCLQSAIFNLQRYKFSANIPNKSHSICKI